MSQNLYEKEPSKDLPLAILSVFIIFIVVLSKKYGIKFTSEIIQSFGIGLGSFFAGFAGLTALLDWYGKIRRSERYIRELKDKYPRNLLNKGKLRIVRKKDDNMIYLLDERNKTSRWFQDQEARKDLGFSSSDTSADISKEELARYSEGDPIVSKKNY